jgi:hypothetical protein
VPRRIYLADNDAGDPPPLDDIGAFRSYADRLRRMGFTELAVHHPRPDDPLWTDDPAVVDRIAEHLVDGSLPG